MHIILFFQKYLKGNLNIAFRHVCLNIPKTGVQLIVERQQFVCHVIQGVTAISIPVKRRIKISHRVIGKRAMQ
jgi:hypothetical protein